MDTPEKKALHFKREFNTTGTLIFIVVFLALILIIGGAAIKTTLTNLKYRSICPDYFSSLDAFIVGPDGTGLDSISVTLRDNSNITAFTRPLPIKTVGLPSLMISTLLLFTNHLLPTIYM